MEHFQAKEIGSLWSLKDLPAKERAGKIFFLLLLLVAVTVGAVCVKNAVDWVDRPFAGFLFNKRVAVGVIGQYHWSGIKAGLKNQDRILAANGKSIPSAQELKNIVEHSEVGSLIRYTVERNGRTFDVSIRTMRFTWTDLFMTFGVIFVLGVLYLLMGNIVFILKPNTRVSWIFLVGCLLQGISSFTSFDLESTHSGFVRAYLFDDVFFPAVVTHLALMFPERSTLLDRYPSLEALPYILSAMLVIPVELLYPGPKFVSVYRGALLYIVVSAMALIASILRSYFKPASVLAKQRARVMLFGAAIALPIPVAAPLIAATGSTVGGTKVLTNFFSLPAVFFPASVAYAIAKHNLFDVDVYVKRAVGYGIMTILVGAGYFFMQIIVRSLVLRPVFGELAENIYPIFFALLVVFFYSPINQKVQDLVEKLFYRKTFDYKDTVLSVSNALTSVLNIDEIMKRIIGTLRTEMFIDKAGVILLEPRKACRALFITEHAERKEDQIVEQCFPSDDPLVSLVASEKKLITTYDIAEAPRYSAVRESCGERFSGMKASVAIPLIYKNSVTGILTLGYKKSGQFYSREDIHLLETLANQGAVAIENAKMAEQMKKEEIVRTNLSRYLSPQIVEQVIHKDVNLDLGGDKKVVTVLFSDIRNFTKISEKYNPEQLVSILNEYFTEMAGIIFEHQGSLDKYIGDAIVAVFGSLIPLENSARNAAQAAIQMMKYMPKLNEKLGEQHGLAMDIGIGINTGEVFLGNIGSPERMEFTVIGDAVNVASRFSGLAKPGQILITRESLASLGTDLPYRELPPTEVKGKTGKMDVFQIMY
jgi:class 3 adenylate cyclase